jgi:hypothetical protein
MAREPELRREVAELQELELLARAAAPREPWTTSGPSSPAIPCSAARLGLGAAPRRGLARGSSASDWRTSWPPAEPLVLKLVVGALVAGFALLLGATLRARLRTLPLDPYRKVRR